MSVTTDELRKDIDEAKNKLYEILGKCNYAPVSNEFPATIRTAIGVLVNANYELSEAELRKADPSPRGTR